MFKPFKVAIREEHLRALREKRIYLADGKKWTPGWMKPGAVFAVPGPAHAEPYSCFRKAGPFFSMGSFSYSRSSFPFDQSVGRYCAIADGVEVLGVNHPQGRLSMGGFDYSTRAFYVDAVADLNGSFRRAPMRSRHVAPPRIEHDVWIGSRAILARGIVIGTGSIVAAGAIVTKDVPPYAMVAGNPAVVKKYRFGDALIERLLASRWWDYSFTDFGGMDTTRPERFLDRFEARVAAGELKPYQPDRIALHALFGTGG